MNTIDQDLLSRLMSLPDGARMDLLEFLGAAPAGDAQMNDLISGLGKAIEEKRRTRMDMAS